MAVRVAQKYSDNKQEIFFVKGALEKVLPQCTKFAVPGNVMQLSKQKEQEILSEAYEIGRKGKNIFFLLNINSY